MDNHLLFFMHLQSKEGSPGDANSFGILADQKRYPNTLDMVTPCFFYGFAALKKG